MPKVGHSDAGILGDHFHHVRMGLCAVLDAEIGVPDLTIRIEHDVDMPCLLRGISQIWEWQLDVKRAAIHLRSRYICRQDDFF